ncbi:uncharacterized protein LOC128723908 [Anopheles nili]|uniref:uncharacterized protein LOC128723908 n=1 Tax=Anopheles nili TaxID=185578 RepID=UPI00237A77A8|nr:uncharacterized protein LOC128723908 [Anopheles nili]
MTVYNSYSSDRPNATQPQPGVASQQAASESSARGFPSGGGGFPFSIHPDFLSKPVQVARSDTGYKTPKYIVYPSYSDNSPNSVPSYYNTPVAMDRFAPGEAYGGTLYKLKKQKQSFQPGGGASFASIPAASVSNPVSVPSPNFLRPAASDNSPVTVLAPPGGAPATGPAPSPPGPPSAPPSPGMQPIFMPTPVPNSGEDSSPSPQTSKPPEASSSVDSSEIILFPPNSHSGYLPPKVVKVQDASPSPSSTPKPAVDLYRFPPNTNASYGAPSEKRSKNPVTSYLPPASGMPEPGIDASSEPAGYKGSEELFKFPPNVDSGYLPPTEGADDSTRHTGTSYLPPASGDPLSPANLQPGVIDSVGTNPELHRFPPNALSDYPPASQKAPSEHSGITSYLPPPSGDPQAPVNLKPSTGPMDAGGVPTGLYKFPPNIQTGYLPAKRPSESPVTSYLPPPSGVPNSPSNPPLPPPPAMRPYVAPAGLYRFPPNVQSQYLPPSLSPPRPNNAVTSYLPPASGIPGDDAIGTIPVGPGKPQYLPPRYPDSGPPMQTAPMAPMKIPPMMSMMSPMGPPPDAAMDGPPTGPSGADHDHHHHHHPEHDFPYFTGFDHDHYPDVIYDHDHFHHHHDEPTTTPAPPPPPPPAPETPRLKNYSYYYLSRTLWYVPLYFTLYFTVYVAILIIRSIARHKVNLPNQWVGRSESFGSVRDLSDKEAQRKATMMATFMMQQIEDFREKYL